MMTKLKNECKSLRRSRYVYGGGVIIKETRYCIKYQMVHGVPSIRQVVFGQEYLLNATITPILSVPAIYYSYCPFVNLLREFKAQNTKNIYTTSARICKH